MSKPVCLPKDLPNVKSALLPGNYMFAKETLRRCLKVDECAKWSDTDALASYLRQAKDAETLEKQAAHIRARAIKRCGELLNELRERGRVD